MVDAKNFRGLNQYLWYYCPTRGGGYAVRRDRFKRMTYMHNVIKMAPLRMEIDHRNLDGLDNRGRNLRVGTKSQNRANCLARRIPNKTSMFKGVSYCRREGNWAAKIQVRGQTHHLGRSATENGAALIYNLAARRHFGRFARLNEL